MAKSLKGSLASPSAVAQIMTQKFVMCAPLYRQEADFKRWGVALSRQTMANWVIRCAAERLAPIYALLKALLIKESLLHADETPLQVLKEPGRPAQSKSYMWLYRTSGCAERAIVLYEYQPSRGHEYPKAFLEGFTGYLHTDGYAAYHALTGVTVIGCWAHMKRKWLETLKALPPADRRDSRAQIGLDYCDKLFSFERRYAALSPKERHKKRLAESKPVAEAYFAWAEALTALPKTRLGIALQYAKEQKQWLMNVYLDGRLELSNNRGERSIKPFVMGRKNWLFSATPKGAQASATVYAIIETAIENNLNPFEYLKYLFEAMPNIQAGALEALLPWSESLPERCRSKAKKEAAP